LESLGAFYAEEVPGKCRSFDSVPVPVVKNFQFAGPEALSEPVEYQDITDRYPDANVDGLDPLLHRATGRPSRSNSRL